MRLWTQTFSDRFGRRTMYMIKTVMAIDLMWSVRPIASDKHYAARLISRDEVHAYREVLVEFLIDANEAAKGILAVFGPSLKIISQRTAIGSEVFQRSPRNSFGALNKRLDDLVSI